MSRIPRCPSCRAYLATTRTLDESWRQGPEGRWWTYRVSCANCLAVARIERREIDASGRASQSTPAEEIAGAVVARAIDRLRAAEGGGQLAEEVTRLREGEGRVLLRVPEVFDAARRFWGTRVRLVEDAHFVSADPLHGNAVDPAGRIELREIARDDEIREGVAALVTSKRILPPAAIASPEGRVIVLAGTAFAVLGSEEGTFLLDARDLPVHGERMELTQVEALIVHADLLAPALDSP